MSELSRRSLVASASALPALAIPAATSSAQAAEDRLAVVARAEQMVETLRDCFVCDDWHERFDQQRASEFLDAVRQQDYSADDDPKLAIITTWVSDHGQSLDWLYFGDPGGLISRAAARSPSAERRWEVGMSADIIEFGKPARRAPAHKGPSFLSDTMAPRRVRRRRSNEQKPIEKTSVRFVFDDELYEVHFYGEAVQDVYAVQYRISANGVDEMRRRRSGGWRSLEDIDPAVVAAAKQARESAGSVDAVPFYKGVLSQLLKRREKLAATLQKVDATIVSMQQHISN
jgi:hypothetical protein